MNSPDAESPDPEKRTDSRLRTFLRKAAPIIAAEKGINARSRVKLESLAADMKLPGELFEKALEMLQKEPHRTTSQYNRWERAFAKKLTAQFKHIESGILTAGMEQKAVEVAKAKFQLEEIQAREIIQKVAQEMGIGRISMSEAERHLEELIKERIGNSTWLDPANRERLHYTGQKLGLSPEHVDTLITYYTQSNRDQHKRDKRKSNAAVAVVTLTIIAILVGGFVVFLIQNDVLDISSGDGTGKGEGKSSKSAADDPAIAKQPEWWTESIRLAAVKSRVNVDGFSGIYEDIISSDTNVRAAGYRRMAALSKSVHGDREARDRMRSLISLLVTHETSDVAADALTEALLTLAQPDAENLPSAESDYGVAFWAVELLAMLSADNRVPESRRIRIGNELTLITGMDSINAFSGEEVAARHQRGLSNALYRSLIGLAATKPKQGLTRLQWLRDLADDHLSEEQLIQNDSDFVLSVLPFDLEDWERFSDLIDRCMSRENPRLYRFITLAETTSSTELQQHLFRRLLATLGVRSSTRDPEELASELRRNLGVVPGAREDAAAIRWAKLKRRIEQLDPASRIAPLPTPPSTEKVLELSHFVTLACALAQTPPRFADFDQRLDEGVPALRIDPRELTGDGGSSARRPASRTDRERLERFALRFTRWREQTPLQRTQAMRGLQSLSERFDDLPADFATPIGEYLAGDKSQEEHLEVLTTLSDIGHWNSLLLAFADAIANSPLQREWLEQVFSELTGIRLLLEGGADWRTSLRSRLLNVVLQRVAASRSSERMDLKYDILERKYVEQLNGRVALMRDFAPRSSTRSASGAWRNQVEQILTRAGSSGEGVDGTLDVASELKSIEYLAENDLARSVLMQRIAVRLLKDWVIRSNPADREDAQRVVRELNDLDQRSTNLICQLYAGEWAYLQLWMMFAP